MKSTKISHQQKSNTYYLDRLGKELLNLFERIKQAKHMKLEAESTELKNEIACDIESMRAQVYLIKDVVGKSNKSDNFLIKYFNKPIDNQYIPNNDPLELSKLEGLTY